MLRLVAAVLNYKPRCRSRKLPVARLLIAPWIPEAVLDREEGVVVADYVPPNQPRNGSACELFSTK